MPELRRLALEVLSSAVGGDQLAAEYLLLQLVSRCAPSLNAVVTSRLLLWCVDTRAAAV